MSKYNIGDHVTDETSTYKGVVCIKWDDGDICYFENDAAHPNPRIIGDACTKGGLHEWVIDGMHSNLYCEKCFISKP